MNHLRVCKNDKQFNVGNSKQKGFTVIELLMVVVIIGILSYVAMSAFSGNPSAANATAVRATAQEIAKGMGYMNANLGIGIGKTTVLAPTPVTSLDVLIMGDEVVADDFKARYKAMGMRPLQSDFRIKTRATKTTAGEYSLLNYPVDLDDSTKCPVDRVCVKFSNVPTDVTREIFTRFGYDKEADYPAVVDDKQTSPVAYTKGTGTTSVNIVRFALIP